MGLLGAAREVEPPTNGNPTMKHAIEGPPAICRPRHGPGGQQTQRHGYETHHRVAEDARLRRESGSCARHGHGRLHWPIRFSLEPGRQLGEQSSRVLHDLRRASASGRRCESHEIGRAAHHHPGERHLEACRPPDPQRDERLRGADEEVGAPSDRFGRLVARRLFRAARFAARASGRGWVNGDRAPSALACRERSPWACCPRTLRASGSGSRRIQSVGHRLGWISTASMHVPLVAACGGSPPRRPAR